MFKRLIPKVVVGVFFLMVCGLLIVRRFDVEKSQTVVIIASQNSPWQVGTKIPRGEMIETHNDEYLAIKIGEDVILGIDERSRLELARLYEKERVLKFSRGRIELQTKKAVSIETGKTMSLIENGRAVFINYDYDSMITVAPINGIIRTQIKGLNDALLIESAINIKETNPPTYSNTIFDPKRGPSAPFHEWMKFLPSS